jgi:hypothetical protein
MSAILTDILLLHQARLFRLWLIRIDFWETLDSVRMNEGFEIISGNSLYNNKNDLYIISNKAKERYSTYTTAHHEWIDSIKDLKYRNAIENIRNSRSIIEKMKEKFPSYSIQNVSDADEVYWAVSPKFALGSDRALVDCHYDAPFGWFPTGGVIFYRVIIATNENNTVTTVFPDENKEVKMSTGDFHGLDYNKDWHCVDGKIPPGKFRVLLKLHYLITPPGAESYNNYVKWINVTWTKLSRETMRMSAKPSNPIEWFVALIVGICRLIFNNTSTSIGTFFILLILYSYFRKTKFPFNTLLKKFKLLTNGK